MAKVLKLDEMLDKYIRKTGYGRNTIACFMWKGGPLEWLQFHQTRVAYFIYDNTELEEHYEMTAGGALTKPPLQPIRVTLNNGGWATRATRGRMEHAMEMVGINTDVVVRDGYEYLAHRKWGEEKYLTHLQEFDGSVTFDPRDESIFSEHARPWFVKYRHQDDPKIVSDTIVVNTPNKPTALLYARTFRLTNGEKIVGVSK